ncbi:uncharacterized protein At4g13200, chloroplastic [Abrus precatorius]|uniref:Uncharacterized protein At4g13200, chloroplastic n=1 Tax=Abrus precatorius TaxID=3816 RepID=A0A8B8JYI3_ABRPR|nr:uncharacterized protein At4g13200, chloroplastic [Abrus precatorius]
MKTVLSPSASPPTFSSPTFSKTYASNFAVLSSSSSTKSTRIELPCRGASQKTALRCNCSIWPGGPASGDSDSSSRSILDAFFLGKAVAEALNERIESTVGEFLGAVGRLQAEQQKQVQDFQDEVLERAKKAKEKATREAMEAQGLISKSAVETKVTDSATSNASNFATGPLTSVQSTDASETYNGRAEEEEPPWSSSNDN